MKKSIDILVSGYYGIPNVGDEAILGALRYQLEKMGVEAPVVFSYAPLQTSDRFGVKAIPELRYAPWLGIRSLFNAKILVLGGGGLLKDEGRLGYALLFAKILLAKLFRCKVIILAVGVGPLYTRMGRWITRWIGSLADTFTVRDAESKKIAQNIGVKRDVQITADLALTLPKIDMQLGKQLLEAHQIYPADGQVLLAVSLRSWYHVPRLWPDGQQRFDAFLDQFARALERILLRWNAIPVFLPFQLKQDAVVCQGLQKRLDVGPKFDVFCQRDMDYLEVASLLANMDFLIGMRLHSLILASLVRTPMVALSYSDKVSNFMGRLECSDRVIDLDHFTQQKLVDVTERILLDRRKAVEDIAKPLAYLKQLGQQNLDYLAEWYHKI